MAKPEKKRQARELRQKGKSIIWIANEIGVSKSSVSVWTRDIQLTEEQEENLRFSNERREAQVKGARANVIKHRQKRRTYQEEGRQKAREGDALHLAGCMLYWAEGRKSRTDLRFTNSDANMMVYYMRFLRESLRIPEHKIKFSLNFYLNNGLSEMEIEDYWLNLLNMDKSQMLASAIHNEPKSSKQQGRKLIYGVCMISANSVKYMQHVYGAVQEYTGLDNEEWLDL